MTTDLHARLDAYRTWVVVLVVLLVGLTVLLGVNQMQIARMQAVQLDMITAAHQRHVDIEQLCESITAQEDIILHEMPVKVFMSWAAKNREICQ